MQSANVPLQFEEKIAEALHMAIWNTYLAIFDTPKLGDWQCSLL